MTTKNENSTTQSTRPRKMKIEKTPSIRDIARQAVETARKQGAREAAADVSQRREVEVAWRDGRLEKISEATTRGLSLQLYVDGRYSLVSTSDLRPQAIESFIADAIGMTRVLARDPHRALPEPALYAGQAQIDLQIEDPRYAGLSAEERRRMAQEMEEAARTVKGSQAILSVTSSVGDTQEESFRVASNGFEGGQRDTSFYISTDVSVKDRDGRRPEDSSFAARRHYGELPEVREVGVDAATRALSRLGARKTASAVMMMAVDNRAAGRLLSYLVRPLMAQAVQQKQSFLEGKLGAAIASRHLGIVDDPLLVRGLGSRLFDGEGLAARRIPIIVQGVLSSYYVDTYYGRKLKMTPTTMRPSNLQWTLSEKSQAQLIADMKEGIFVTGFIGGNSNSTTGDFSLGVQGFRVRAGRLAEPVSEMNIAGNHLELWKQLVAVGNDPFPYSSSRTPTLVFEKVQFAGV